MISRNKLSIVSLYEYLVGEKAKIKTVNYEALTDAQIKQKILDKKETKRKRKISDFEFILQDKRLSELFRSMLIKMKFHDLELLLFGSVTHALPFTFTPARSYNMPAEEKMTQHFFRLDKDYKFFSSNATEAHNQFLIFFKICKIIADFFEQNNDAENKAAMHAYKMLVLFGFNEKGNPFNRMEFYLNAHQCYRQLKPIQNALDTDLPRNNPDNEEIIKDIEGWRAFILVFGKKAIITFQEALKIEKMLNRAPKDFGEVRMAKAKFEYPRYLEYPELADLCMEYNLSENIFNKCLELEKKRKLADNLPDVYVHGENLGHPGYVFLKLPFDDPRAYLLGYITHCSLCIGRHSEECVMDGITRKNNGFYVLLKRNKKSDIESAPIVNGKINYDDFAIVGQSYAWISQWKNLVLDSFENLRPEKDDVAVSMLHAFGKQVTEATDMIRIIIGTGSKTPSAFKVRDKRIEKPEKMLEGYEYIDSKYQGLVYLNKAKQEKMIADLMKQSRNGLFCEDEIEFKKLIHADEIVSQEHGKWIATLLSQPISKSILIQNDLTTWEVLYFLHKAGDLNKLSCQLFIQANCLWIEDLADALRNLNQALRLNEANIHLLKLEVVNAIKIYKRANDCIRITLRYKINTTTRKILALDHTPDIIGRPNTYQFFKPADDRKPVKDTILKQALISYSF